MKQLFILFILMILGVGFVYSGTVPFTFQAKTKIIGNTVRYENRAYTYYFKVEVISDLSGKKSEQSRDGKPFIEAVPEERYAIRVYNPLPVRVGVNLTVDGLSSITGKPVSPSGGNKWIIGPYSFITIRGWQVSGDDVRRFFFTSKDASYAAWRSNAWGKDLSVNCGVIGAAYFWSKADMENWLEANPVYEKVYYEEEYSKSDRAAAPAAKSANQQAGTGMGEEESHPVRTVSFYYDMGMYRASQAVVIYYDFIGKEPQPNPFPDEFAPKMP